MSKAQKAVSSLRKKEILCVGNQFDFLFSQLKMMFILSTYKVKSGQMSIAEILDVLMKETTTLISRICRFKYSGLLNHY